MDRAELNRALEEIEPKLRLARISFSSASRMHQSPIFSGENSDAYFRAKEKVEVLEDEKANIESLIAKLDKEEEEARATLRQHTITTEVESAAFWYRRFNTSLAIANGAGVAAIASKLFDKDTAPEVLGHAWTPMALFSLGMVLAGSIPIALYSRREWVGRFLSGGSAACLIVALISILWAIWQTADLVFPWQL